MSSWFLSSYDGFVLKTSLTHELFRLDGLECDEIDSSQNLLKPKPDPSDMDIPKKVKGNQSDDHGEKNNLGLNYSDADLQASQEKKNEVNDDIIEDDLAYQGNACMRFGQPSENNLQFCSIHLRSCVFIFVKIHAA